VSLPVSSPDTNKGASPGLQHPRLRSLGAKGIIIFCTVVSVLTFNVSLVHHTQGGICTV